MYVWFQYKYDFKERFFFYFYYYTDKWDSYYVRMLCFNQSEFLINNKVFVSIFFIKYLQVFFINYFIYIIGI